MSSQSNFEEVNENEPVDHLFRYIVIGDVAVGKSCLLLQFTDHTFRHQHELTLGAEFGSKVVRILNKVVKIQIWDTAGQEAFQAITRTYYKGAVVALVVYDITRRETFEHVQHWLHEIENHGSDNVKIILIGNKSDLDNRAVTTEEAQQFAKSKNLVFLETSAKNDYNVREAFISMAEKVVSEIIKTGKDPSIPNNNIKLGGDDEEEEPKKEKKCCG